MRLSTTINVIPIGHLLPTFSRGNHGSCDLTTCSSVHGHHIVGSSDRDTALQ